VHAKGSTAVQPAYNGAVKNAMWADLRGSLASDRWMSRCAARGWRGASASALPISRSASAALGRSRYP
jgi:hypothetical protein